MFHPPSENEGIHIVNNTWVISADLGQANDFTAISVIKRSITGYGVLGADKNGIRELSLVHLERMRDMPYPDVVERLKSIYHSEALKGVPKCIVIDFTGLGRPVYDLMKQAGFQYSLNAISITGGQDPTFHATHFNVPKRDLVSRLQIELQNGELKIAKGLKEANALVEELANFQTKISQAGNDTYNGKTGHHDDMVMSVAMGVWLACRDRIRNTGDDKFM